MSTKVEILWRQALNTFSGRWSENYKFCLKKFEKLKSLIDDIQAEDVYVDKKVIDFVQNQPAPMCVIDVFENEDLTMAIFMLKKDVTLPMHDHPAMHGLLKVISGTVKIDSYSLENNTQALLEQGEPVPAIRHQSIVLTPSDPATVLTPTVMNLHEISSINGPAAFLDILSPSYDEFGEGKRPCTYFKVIDENKSSDKVNLIISGIPSHFYSRSIKYRGEPLNLR